MSQTAILALEHGRCKHDLADYSCISDIGHARDHPPPDTALDCRSKCAWVTFMLTRYLKRHPHGHMDLSSSAITLANTAP
eukprot:4363100-Amphidinium_carterae.1